MDDAISALPVSWLNVPREHIEPVRSVDWHRSYPGDTDGTGLVVVMLALVWLTANLRAAHDPQVTRLGHHRGEILQRVDGPADAADRASGGALLRRSRS